jgi:hypothetical protein
MDHSAEGTCELKLVLLAAEGDEEVALLWEGHLYFAVRFEIIRVHSLGDETTRGKLFLARMSYTVPVADATVMFAEVVAAAYSMWWMEATMTRRMCCLAMATNPLRNFLVRSCLAKWYFY